MGVAFFPAFRLGRGRIDPGILVNHDKDEPKPPADETHQDISETALQLLGAGLCEGLQGDQHAADILRLL